MDWIIAAAFAASVCGHVFYAARLTRTDFCFAPLFAAACLGLALYAGALADAPEQTAYLLFAAGLPGFARCVSLARRGRLRPRAGLRGACFAAGTAAFAVLIFRLRLTHYDNFSHWALAVKSLLCTDALPRADTALLDFPDYPPGTTLLCYYAGKFLGTSQTVMLLAHNAVLFACFWAMFGVVRERRRFLPYALIGAGCAMLSYLNLTIRINNLLVDFLLPLLTASAAAAADRYRDEPARLSAWCAAVLGFTGIVKNTGFFFAVVGYAFYLAALLRTRGAPPRRRTLCAVLTGAAAALPALLWRAYVNTALAGFDAKFDFSAGNSAVPPELRGRIARDFLRAALDPADRAAQVIFLCNVLALGATVFARVRLGRRWRLGAALIAADAAAAAYYAGLLWLYLYSMPQEEAVRLAGFERYACSAAALCAAIVILYAARDVENSFAVPIGERGAHRAFSSPDAKRRYQYGVLAALAVAVNFLYSEWNGLAAASARYPDTLPAAAQRVLGDAWPEDGRADTRRYLVAASDRDGQVSSGEARYVCRYFLYAPNVDVTASLNADAVRAAAGRYDFIAVLDAEAVTPEAEALGVPAAPGLYPVRSGAR